MCRYKLPLFAALFVLFSTLLYALQSAQAKTGLATLCIGGGEAVAMIIERV